MTGSVGDTLDEPDQAVALVARGRIETVVDRLLPREPFQAGSDALVGRAVLVP